MRRTEWPWLWSVSSWVKVERHQAHLRLLTGCWTGPASSTSIKREQLQGMKSLSVYGIFPGADTRARTGDLFITNELLYQLSHIGLLAPVWQPQRPAIGICGAKVIYFFCSAKFLAKNVATRGLSLQFGLQIAACDALRTAANLLGSACGNERSALVAPFGTEVDEMVGTLDDV